MRSFLCKSKWIVLTTEWLSQPKRQLPSSSHNHNSLTTIRTSVKEPLQVHFKVAVKNSILLMQAGDSLTDVLRVVSVLWL